MTNLFSFLNAFSLKSLFYLKTFLKVLYFSTKIKFILILFTCFYAVLLCLVYYFLFKGYQSTIEFINTNKLTELNRDIVTLLYSHPLHESSFRYHSPSLIHNVYKIYGITNYQDFIHSSSQEMVSLHNILDSNPVVGSKFSSLVLQDMIRDHSEVMVDVTYKLLKTVFKLSLPLGGSLLSLLGLYIFQGNSTQILSNITGL